MPFRSRRRRLSRQDLCLFTVVAALVFAGRDTVRAAGSGTTQEDAGLSCQAIMVAGLSSGDGLYWIDPNGGSTSDGFQAYCDMTTDGGGWTLAVNSVAGEEPLTNDMTSNTGTPGLDRGHTRNGAYLAVNNDAEIRYVLDDSPRSRMFHAKFSGRFHAMLPPLSGWTMLPGHTSAGDALFADHMGMNWSTSLSDRDRAEGSCASSYGDLPWHYTACWMSIPTNPLDGLIQGPPTNGGSGGAIMARFSIFVRELVTLSPQPTNVTPSFGLTANLPVGAAPVDVAIADFDSDGQPDIVTAGGATVTVRYGNGAVFHRGTRPDAQLRALATGDFTSDNRLDFVTVDSIGGINLFVNNGGTDSNSAFTPRYSQGCAAKAIGTGDFDQNGTPDLALLCGASLTIAANSSGWFSAVRSFFISVDAQSLAVADFDSDTRMDIVVTAGIEGGVHSFQALGGFAFAPNRSYPGSYMGPVAVGDWSRDGRPDLVVGGRTQIVSLRNLDGLHFTAVATSPVDSIVDVALADVDANGRLDVIVAHDAAAMSVGLGSGFGPIADGFFTLAPASYGTSSVPRTVAVGDWNGDGKPDIATTDYATDSVSVFANSLINAAPSASDGTLTVIEGTTEVGSLRATDPDGLALTFTLTSTGAKGTATITSAASGTYQYTANAGESGTDTFTFTASDGVNTSNVGTITVTITPKRTPHITWPTPASIRYGTPLTSLQLNATVEPGVTGTFTYSPALGTVLPAGPAQVLSVVFTPSDTARYQSTTSSVLVDVLPAPLTVRASTQSIPYGLPILPPLTATFHGFVNGDTPASLSGVLTLTGPSSMDAGVYPITPGGVSSPNYAITFEPGMLTILQVSTAVVLAAGPATVGVLQPVTLTASIGSVPSVLGVPTGTVQFFDGTTLLGTAAVVGAGASGGSAGLTVNGLPPGVHAFTATYLGDGNFRASLPSAAASLTVRPLAESTFTLAYATGNPTALGQRATFAAAVVSFGDAVPTGTVAFVAARVVIGTATLSGGVATMSTTSLGAGPHFVVAFYLGNASFAPSKSTPAAHSVYSGTPLPTASMTLSGPGAPSTLGHPVTFTATVTPSSGTRTGSVVFFVNDTLLGLGPIVDVGGVLQASVTTTALPVGVNVIAAIDVGHGVFAAASAGPIVQEVR